MSVYADSSFLISLNGNDDFTEAARRLMSRLATALPFNPLHRLEVRNGLRLCAHRKQMTEADVRTALRQIDEDLRDGVLIREPIPWTDALRRAEELSAKQAVKLGNRSMDVLHIAIALERGSKRFLSFDKRQRDLARATGLKVMP